jgi:hypothetical protein
MEKLENEEMKKVEIKQFDFAEVDSPKETFGFLKIPVEHKLIRAEGENLEVSDGYHTFDELYEHRIVLFIALCKAYHPPVWCSVFHSDGTQYGDWFILGIGKEKGKQITYHLPAKYWSEVCEFAEVLEKAPEFDGHTSQDVLERLKNL